MNTQERKTLKTVLLLTMAAIAAADRPAHAGVVARIGTATISDKDLAALTSRDAALEKKGFDTAKRQLEMRHSRRQHAMNEAALNRAIDDRALALEAAALGTTPETLLDNVKPRDVKPDEIRAYYIANEERIAEPLSDSAQKVLDILNAQAKEKARAAFRKSLREK